MPVSIDLNVYLAVGVGGAIGACSRFGISLFFPDESPFPYATLLANLIGCFLLSYLLHHERIKKKLSPAIFTGLSTGIIGSFTTFSTFALETKLLWQSNSILAGLYAALSVFAGLTFCFFGFYAARGLKR